MKYGFRDYRGGGRSSGRETIGRVAAGAIAVKILDQLGIRLMTYSKSIGPIACDPRHFDAEEILKNPVYMPDADAAENAMAYLEACIAEQNSSGGVVECIISGVPAGIGDPVFEKLNANLAKAVMSIGAVKVSRLEMVLTLPKQPARTITMLSASERMVLFPKKQITPVVS